jgi:hypothetical protein
VIYNPHDYIDSSLHKFLRLASQDASGILYKEPPQESAFSGYRHHADSPEGLVQFF